MATNKSIPNGIDEHIAKFPKDVQAILEKVRETNSIKSNFLALASHELRTPLGIIIGYATFLQEEAKGELSDHAQQVLNAAAQMRSLLDQMNNLTLLQTDEMEMRPSKISVQDVLNFACDEIKYFAARRNLELVYAFQDDPIYVEVDPEKTTLAFVNLLNNAIRFSSEGSQIVIGAIEQGKQVMAWVQDNGKGIPGDKLQKIFEEFYQLEPPNTRSYGGLGIGLTIARGLIEVQGGKIWAESEGSGKGATLKVLLPKA